MMNQGIKSLEYMNKFIDDNADIQHGNGWKITISRTYVGYTNSYNKAISMKRNAEKELWKE